MGAGRHCFAGAVLKGTGCQQEEGASLFSLLQPSRVALLTEPMKKSSWQKENCNFPT